MVLKPTEPTSAGVTRRSALAHTLALGGALVSAACGERDTAGPKPAAAPATIEYFHEWEGPRMKLVEDMIAGFQALNPTITIKPRLSRGNLSMEQIFGLMVAGNPPDVVMTTTPTGVVWAAKEALRWLDDRLKKDKISTEQVFYKATLDLVRLKGQHYGLPNLVAGADPVLMYNRRLFGQLGFDPAAPPKTWQEAEALSAKATVREGDRLTRIGLVPTQQAFQTWLYLDDGAVFSPDGTKVAFNSPQGQETLTWLADFTQRLYGGLAAVNDFYQTYRTPESQGIPGRGLRLPWYSNREAMWVDLVSIFFYIDDEEPGFPLGVGQPPYNAKNPKAKVTTVAWSVWMYALPQGTKQEDATWTWFKYITMGEGAKQFILAQKRPSPVRKFTEDKAYRDLNPHWDAIIKNLEASVGVSQTPALNDVAKAMSTATSSVLTGKQGVKEALDQAARDAQTAMDQYRS